MLTLYVTAWPCSNGWPGAGLVVRSTTGRNRFTPRAEDDLRERAPNVGEHVPELVVAHRRIRLPRKHGLVQPAAQQIAAELAYLRDVETEQLLARDRPPKRALAVGDKAVHRDAHRVDQHRSELIAAARHRMIAVKLRVLPSRRATSSN